MLRVDLFSLTEHHLDPGQDKKGAKQVEHPVKSADKCHACANHRQAHDQRAENAPEENLMLPLWRYSEVRENQRKHEDVVHAERILNQPAGVEFERLLVSGDLPHTCAEEQSESDPGRGPAKC